MLFNVGNVIPTMKLNVHDDKLPNAIATGRGPTSKSSEKKNNLVSFDREFKHEVKLYSPAAMKYGMGPSPN